MPGVSGIEIPLIDDELVVEVVSAEIPVAVGCCGVEQKLLLLGNVTQDPPVLMLTTLPFCV